MYDNTPHMEVTHMIWLFIRVPVWKFQLVRLNASVKCINYALSNELILIISSLTDLLTSNHILLQPQILVWGLAGVFSSTNHKLHLPLSGPSFRSRIEPLLSIPPIMC